VKEDYPIVVTAPDFDRLRNLRVHRALGAELDRAVVLRSSSVPPDLVTMNSRLIFEDESTDGSARTLQVISLLYQPEAAEDAYADHG